MGRPSYDCLIDIAAGIAVQASTLSSKYQLVIPRPVRDRYGLAPGQRLQFVCLPDRIELIPLRAPEDLRGFLPGANDFCREGERL